MNKEAQSVVVVLLGGLMVSITVSGRYTAYVKPGFGPLLLIGGIVLILVGVISLFTVIRAEIRRDKAAAQDPTAAVDHDHDHDEADHHGHDHSRSKAPWLILAPVLVLLVMAPPALGAASVNRNAGSQALAGMEDADSGVTTSVPTSVQGYAFNDGSGRGQGTENFAKKRRTMDFPALPDGAEPALLLREFVLRALYDGENSVSRTPITVTGFIAPAGDGYDGGYSIARLAIACCAADATAIRVHVDGDAPLPVDTWVSAVITAVPDTAGQDNEYVPTVTVSSMTPVEQPADPYE